MTRVSLDNIWQSIYDINNIYITMVKKNKQKIKNIMIHQQHTDFNPVRSKKSKKNSQNPTKTNLSRSAMTKQRNRQNAELDRYKRRLLSQYTRSLPILVREAPNQNQMAIKKYAMDKAFGRFVNFHNTHIVQEGQTFTINSIRPQLRTRFQNFVNNLMSYTLQQLADLDERDLLSHQDKRMKEQNPQEQDGALIEQKESTGDIEMVNGGKEVDCSGLRVIQEGEPLRRVSMKQSKVKMRYSVFTFLLLGIVLCSFQDNQNVNSPNKRLLLDQNIQSGIDIQISSMLSEIGSNNQKRRDSQSINEKRIQINYKILSNDRENYNLQVQTPSQAAQTSNNIRSTYYKNQTNLPEQIAPQCFSLPTSCFLVTFVVLTSVFLLFVCVCNLGKTWKKLKKYIKKCFEEEVMV